MDSNDTKQPQPDGPQPSAASAGSATSEYYGRLSYAMGDVIAAVNASCSCGGKGPNDGCCEACEVWHRLNGHSPNDQAER